MPDQQAELPTKLPAVRMRGRKSKGGRAAVTTRLGVDLYADLAEAAQAQARSVSEEVEYRLTWWAKAAEALSFKNHVDQQTQDLIEQLKRDRDEKQRQRDEAIRQRDGLLRLVLKLAPSAERSDDAQRAFDNELVQAITGDTK
jgi:hypothetical protein